MSKVLREPEPAMLECCYTSSGNTKSLETQSVGFDEKQNAGSFLVSTFNVIFYQRHICFQYLHMWLQLNQETNSPLVERFGLSFTPTEHQFLSSVGETPGK